MRQSVSLPVKVATQVRTMAKSRRLSATRMLVELIENGIEAERQKQQAFFELAERFRNGSLCGRTFRKPSGGTWLRNELLTAWHL